MGHSHLLITKTLSYVNDIFFGKEQVLFDIKTYFRYNYKRCKRAKLSLEWIAQLLLRCQELFERLKFKEEKKQKWRNLTWQ